MRTDWILHVVDRQTKKKKFFLYRIVILDEKWNYSNNPKQKRLWVDPISNIHFET